MKLGGSDKTALTSLVNGLVNDIATLRAANAAMAAKLDLDAGVTDTNYTANTAVAVAALTVGK
jgi:hypothetical protein